MAFIRTVSETEPSGKLRELYNSSGADGLHTRPFIRACIGRV